MSDIVKRDFNVTGDPGMEKDRCSDRESVFFKCSQSDSITVRLAGIPVEITTPSLQIMLPTLEPFLDRETPRIHVRVDQEEILETGKRLQEHFKKIGRPLDALTPYMFELRALRHKILGELIWYDVIYLHGSAVLMDGSAFLFMAPSGTGKSTHARLWREYFGDRVTMLNDDKPLIRFENGRILICGSPWTGKHGLGVNLEIPLRAIIRIRRAQQNSIKDMNEFAAFKTLYEGTLRFKERDKIERLLPLLSHIIEETPFYELRCNMEYEAVETAYGILRHLLL